MPIKLSIIVPVYNSGKYLAACIESLLIQDVFNMELILVDDGSTDGSGAVIDGYAARDSRIIAVHQANAGVSAARNAGLDLSRGEWIAFVDSDDTVEPNAYAYLLELAREQQADAVMFEHSVDYEDGRSCPHRFSDASRYGLLDRENAMRLVYGGACFSVTKLYSKRIVGSLRYKQEIYRGEDTIFVIEALHNAKRVYSSDRVLYHYIQSVGSAARGGVNARQLTGIDALKWMLDFADGNYPELHSTALRAYVNIMVEFYYEMQACGYSSEGTSRRILTETKKYMKEVLTATDTAPKARLKFLLFAISPKLFFTLLHRFRGGRE